MWKDGAVLQSQRNVPGKGHPAQAVDAGPGLVDEHLVEHHPHPLPFLRRFRALCVETHEAGLEDNRDLNMTLLAEQRKEVLRLAA